MRRVLSAAGVSLALPISSSFIPISTSITKPLLIPVIPQKSVGVLFCSVRSFHHTAPLFRRIKKNFGRRKREPKEGDWTCQCGEINYRSKRECYKCGAPAPPLPPGVRRPMLPGEDPNDWACPCGQMNFRGKVSCYKCNQPKPDAPAEPGMEVTQWKCPKCKGINRSTRKFCFKCFTSQEVAIAAAEAAKQQQQQTEQQSQEFVPDDQQPQEQREEGEVSLSDDGDYQQQQEDELEPGEIPVRVSDN